MFKKISFRRFVESRHRLAFVDSRISFLLLQSFQKTLNFKSLILTRFHPASLTLLHDLIYKFVNWSIHYPCSTSQFFIPHILNWLIIRFNSLGSNPAFIPSIFSPWKITILLPFNSKPLTLHSFSKRMSQEIQFISLSNLLRLKPHMPQQRIFLNASPYQHCEWNDTKVSS